MKPTSSKGSSTKRGGKGVGAKGAGGKGGAGAGRGAARSASASSSAGGARSGGRAGGGAGSGGRSSAAAGGGPRGGSTKFASRGQGRTGKVSPTGAPARKPEKTLGGEQIEGRQAVRELLLAGRRRVREIWIASDLDDNETVQDIVDIASHERVPVQHVARKRLEAAARSEAPQGIIAYANGVPEADLADLVRRSPGRPAPFLVAVDGVTDPGNLGALLRSCEGAGVQGVLLPRHRAVHVTPTVAKAAAGAVEYVPMVMVGGLPSALTTLRDQGIWVVGLADEADRELFDLGELATDGICIVMGAEGAGLSRLVRERCDMIVSIPMLGRLSSLNVSAAAALATYEVTRARRRTT
ncbi:MAG: 23S rRNA (guanosine(2251)-2'-O)-methyltransferase RlmB [Acidimicrobiales bacterium]|nr:23S rRNA (guanosine(2251)-2'-O)-methyltransferase RlmB [Acidimicrobiales bacterium]MCB9395823.1 23S rRNA (guanosine(2251)-2'-O)-methyltransferase RlmB [Acidimicrobiaceae bacterium]